MASVDLYDGNNVMIRALTNFNPHNRSALDLRRRFAASRANEIWCFDGRNHNDRRREIYAPYKRNREPLGENIYSYINLWKQLLQHSPASMVEVPLWEADDVIGTLARRFAARGTSVVVHSNDADYLQLTANPLIRINGVQNPPTDGKLVALYKACVGDSSDNIKGIPGFGKGTWAAMDGHYEALQEAIRTINPAPLQDLPLPKRVKTWLLELENVALVQAMFLITHFFKVPDEELNASVIKGTPDYEKAEALLQRYFL